METIDTIQSIDYTQSIAEITRCLNDNYSLLKELNNTISILTFLMLSTLAIILGIMIVKG